MSKFDWLAPRKRRQHLFIVEGNHEKYKLMELILKVFPEIDMDMGDILIYETNIYLLYNDIEKKYHEDWYHVDIDLPYIVSQKKEFSEPLYKENFTDIILMFDYERHDPNFSEEKILRMQNYFQDSTDVGKLYLNYPMIESYQHLFKIPETEYADRFVPVSLQPGKQYKNLVKETSIAKMVNLPHKIKAILSDRFHIKNSEFCIKCVETFLKSNCEEVLSERIEESLSDVLHEKDRLTARFQIIDIIKKSGYFDYGLDYYTCMRKLFNQIIFHNICKANKIQGNTYEVMPNSLKECFEALDFKRILTEQNKSSQNIVTGIIWVLSTGVFLVPDYNFNLIKEAPRFNAEEV